MVAYQDGSAPWQLAPAPTGDIYTFAVTAPSYGVAFTCITNPTGTTTGQLRSITSAHFAVGERTKLTLDVPSRCSDRAPTNVTLTGIVQNRPQGGVMFVQYGTRSVFVGGGSGTFSLQTPPGTRDLLVMHAVLETDNSFYVDKTLVVRDLAITGATTRTIDFSAAQANATYAVTVNAANSRVIPSTVLYTSNGTAATLVRESSSWKSDALAAAQRRPTDIYDQSIAVSTQGRSATLTNATSSPGAQAYVAPAPLGMPVVSVPTKQPYVTLEATWPAYAGAIGYTWTATQSATCSGNTSCTTTWSAVLSPGVTGTAPAYRMPDLSTLGGWKTDYQFVSGSQIVGSVTALTSTAGATDFPAGIPTAGTQRTFVRSDYGITP